jgi:hypothetical protein
VNQAAQSNVVVGFMSNRQNLPCKGISPILDSDKKSRAMGIASRFSGGYSILSCTDGKNEVNKTRLPGRTPVALAGFVSKSASEKQRQLRICFSERIALA